MGYLYMDGLSMFIMENPIKVDDLGIHLFQETPNYILWHILWYILWYKIYIYIYIWSSCLYLSYCWLSYDDHMVIIYFYIFILRCPSLFWASYAKKSRLVSSKSHGTSKLFRGPNSETPVRLC